MTPTPVHEQLKAGDGGCCHLTRLVGPAADRAPVVFAHGMFTDRRFWLSDKGVGLAAYLAEAGHPVYIVQRRGVSDSPPCEARRGLDEHLRYDLPALSALIDHAHDRPAFWIGHSFGGVTVARAAAEVLPAERIAGLVLLASQFEVGKRLLDWPGNLITRALASLLGYLPARAVGLGPVNEPADAARDACRWVSQGRREPDIRESLAGISAPILAISGAADRVDPTAGCRRLLEHTGSADRRFLVAGTAEGLEQNYDHPGIVVSKAAQREIWPRIRDWLAEREPVGISPSS